MTYIFCVLYLLQCYIYYIIYIFNFLQGLIEKQNFGIIVILNEHPV